MLRSENELNKPSFSKLRNGCQIGRISRRQSLRKKELLRVVNQEYNSYISVSIAEKLLREINEVASYNEQTPEFVEDIRKKIFLLHEYNTHVAKIAYTYPTSKEIYELLGRYVALESDVLYKHEYNFKYEKHVEDRVFHTIMCFLKESFSMEEDCLNDERKRVYDEALKVFVSYVDVKYTNDEDKFPARIVKNILDTLGLIKKTTDNPNGNLDLNNPSLIRLKESLKDSDYGSDDDGQETASVSFESSFRTLFSKRNHEKGFKKDLSSDDVTNSEVTSTTFSTEASESNITLEYSSNDSHTNDCVISENVINELSQSPSIDEQGTHDLQPQCSSSSNEATSSFPSSNEVFFSISCEDIQTFADYDIDDDIAFIKWSTSKSKFPKPQMERQICTVPNTNNNKNLSNVKAERIGDKRNMEYRIYDTISIVSSDEEEEDFVNNPTDFKAIQNLFNERKGKNALLSNLRNKPLTETVQKSNVNNLKPTTLSYCEPLPCHSAVAVLPKEEIVDDNDKSNKMYETKNDNNVKNRKNSDANSEVVIEITSSDEDETISTNHKVETSIIHRNRSPREFSLFPKYDKTPLQKTLATSGVTTSSNISDSINSNNSKDKNLETVQTSSNMGKIFCRSLDELKIITNSVESNSKVSQAESSSEANSSIPMTVLDLSLDENIAENNCKISHKTVSLNNIEDSDSDVEIISETYENIRKDYGHDTLKKEKVECNELSEDLAENKTMNKSLDLLTISNQPQTETIMEQPTIDLSTPEQSNTKQSDTAKNVPSEGQSFLKQASSVTEECSVDNLIPAKGNRPIEQSMNLYLDDVSSSKSKKGSIVNLNLEEEDNDERGESRRKNLDQVSSSDASSPSKSMENSIENLPFENKTRSEEGLLFLDKKSDSDQASLAPKSKSEEENNEQRKGMKITSIDEKCSSNQAPQISSSVNVPPSESKNWSFEKDNEPSGESIRTLLDKESSSDHASSASKSKENSSEINEKSEEDVSYLDQESFSDQTPAASKPEPEKANNEQSEVVERSFSNQTASETKESPINHLTPAVRNNEETGSPNAQVFESKKDSIDILSSSVLTNLTTGEFEMLEEAQHAELASSYISDDENCPQSMMNKTIEETEMFKAGSSRYKDHLISLPQLPLNEKASSDMLDNQYSLSLTAGDEESIKESQSVEDTSGNIFIKHNAHAEAIHTVNDERLSEIPEKEVVGEINEILVPSAYEKVQTTNEKSPISVGDEEKLVESEKSRVDMDLSEDEKDVLVMDMDADLDETTDSQITNNEQNIYKEQLPFQQNVSLLKDGIGQETIKDAKIHESKFVSTSKDIHTDKTEVLEDYTEVESSNISSPEERKIWQHTENEDQLCSTHEKYETRGVDSEPGISEDATSNVHMIQNTIIDDVHLSAAVLSDQLPSERKQIDENELPQPQDNDHSFDSNLPNELSEQSIQVQVDEKISKNQENSIPENCTDETSLLAEEIEVSNENINNIGEPRADSSIEIEYEKSEKKSKDINSEKPENFIGLNKLVNTIPITESNETTECLDLSEDIHSSQAKTLYDDESTSYVIDETQIDNYEETLIVPFDAEAKDVSENVLVIDGSYECDVITLDINTSKEVEISTTLIPDSVQNVNEPIPTENTISAPSNFDCREPPKQSLIAKEVESPFNAMIDIPSGVDLTPKARKNRCSGSHNVVGNLGKAMLLMSNTEPRRTKRNLSFTSPKKMKDPGTVFDTSPTSSNKSVLDLSYNALNADVESNSTTKTFAFTDGTLSHLDKNDLYTSNNFYSTYTPEDARDKEVFLSIEECHSDKQHLNMDILASVASNLQPLKIDKQKDKNSKANISKSPKNKRSSSRKSTENDALQSKQSTSYSPSIDVKTVTNLQSDVTSKTSHEKSKNGTSKRGTKSSKSNKKTDSPVATTRKTRVTKNKESGDEVPETKEKTLGKNKEKKVSGKNSMNAKKDKINMKAPDKTSKISSQSSSKMKSIIENLDSDDSLPLNMRIKKKKEKSKSKDISLKKKRDEDKLTIQVEKESDKEIEIVVDKPDKNNVPFSPIKEEPTKRIVHFKKAMLELISQDLGEHKDTNSKMNEPENFQKPLISCFDNSEQIRSSTDTHCEETTEKFVSAITPMDNSFILEPQSFNSTPEVVVEYKELTNNDYSYTSHGTDVHSVNEEEISMTKHISISKNVQDKEQIDPDPGVLKDLGENTEIDIETVSSSNAALSMPKSESIMTPDELIELEAYFESEHDKIYSRYISKHPKKELIENIEEIAKFDNDKDINNPIERIEIIEQIPLNEKENEPDSSFSKSEHELKPEEIACPSENDEAVNRKQEKIEEKRYHRNSPELNTEKTENNVEYKIQQKKNEDDENSEDLSQKLNLEETEKQDRTVLAKTKDGSSRKKQKKHKKGDKIELSPEELKLGEAKSQEILLDIVKDEGSKERQELNMGAEMAYQTSERLMSEETQNQKRNEEKIETTSEKQKSEKTENQKDFLLDSTKDIPSIMQKKIDNEAEKIEHTSDELMQEDRVLDTIIDRPSRKRQKRNKDERKIEKNTDALRPEETKNSEEKMWDQTTNKMEKKNANREENEHISDELIKGITKNREILDTRKNRATKLQKKNRDKEKIGEILKESEGTKKTDKIQLKKTKDLASKRKHSKRKHMINKSDDHIEQTEKFELTKTPEEIVLDIIDGTSIKNKNMLEVEICEPLVQEEVLDANKDTVCEKIQKKKKNDENIEQTSYHLKPEADANEKNIEHISELKSKESNIPEDMVSDNRKNRASQKSHKKNRNEDNIEKTSKELKPEQAKIQEEMVLDIAEEAKSRKSKIQQDSNTRKERASKKRHTKNKDEETVEELKPEAQKEIILEITKDARVKNIGCTSELKSKIQDTKKNRNSKRGNKKNEHGKTIEKITEDLKPMEARIEKGIMDMEKKGDEENIEQTSDLKSEETKIQENTVSDIRKDGAPKKRHENNEDEEMLEQPPEEFNVEETKNEEENNLKMEQISKLKSEELKIKEAIISDTKKDRAPNEKNIKNKDGEKVDENSGGLEPDQSKDDEEMVLDIAKGTNEKKIELISEEKSRESHIQEDVNIRKNRVPSKTHKKNEDEENIEKPSELKPEEPKIEDGSILDISKDSNEKMVEPSSKLESEGTKIPENSVSDTRKDGTTEKGNRKNENEENIGTSSELKPEEEEIEKEMVLDISKDMEETKIEHFSELQSRETEVSDSRKKKSHQKGYRISEDEEEIKQTPEEFNLEETKHEEEIKSERGHISELKLKETKIEENIISDTGKDKTSRKRRKKNEIKEKILVGLRSEETGNEEEIKIDTTKPSVSPNRQKIVSEEESIEAISQKMEPEDALNKKEMSTDIPGDRAYEKKTEDEENVEDEHSKTNSTEFIETVDELQRTKPNKKHKSQSRNKRKSKTISRTQKNNIIEEETSLSSSIINETLSSNVEIPDSTERAMGEPKNRKNELEIQKNVKSKINTKKANFKKTRKLYDIKQDISSEKIRNKISTDEGNTEKIKKIDGCDYDKIHNPDSHKNEISNDVTSHILFEKISRSNEKKGEKPKRSKRKRSESKTPERRNSKKDIAADTNENKRKSLIQESETTNIETKKVDIRRTRLGKNREKMDIKTNIRNENEADHVIAQNKTPEIIASIETSNLVPSKEEMLVGASKITELHKTNDMNEKQEESTKMLVENEYKEASNQNSFDENNLKVCEKTEDKQDITVSFNESVENDSDVPKHEVTETGGDKMCFSKIKENSSEIENQTEIVKSDELGLPSSVAQEIEISSDKGIKEVEDSKKFGSEEIENQNFVRNEIDNMHNLCREFEYVAIKSRIGDDTVNGAVVKIDHAYKESETQISENIENEEIFNVIEPRNDEDTGNEEVVEMEEIPTESETQEISTDKNLEKDGNNDKTLSETIVTNEQQSEEVENILQIKTIGDGTIELSNNQETVDEEIDKNERILKELEREEVSNSENLKTEGTNNHSKFETKNTQFDEINSDIVECQHPEHDPEDSTNTTNEKKMRRERIIDNQPSEDVEDSAVSNTVELEIQASQENCPNITSENEKSSGNADLTAFNDETSFNSHQLEVEQTIDIEFSEDVPKSHLFVDDLKGHSPEVDENRLQIDKSFSPPMILNEPMVYTAKEGLQIDFEMSGVPDSPKNKRKHFDGQDEIEQLCTSPKKCNIQIEISPQPLEKCKIEEQASQQIATHEASSQENYSAEFNEWTHEEIEPNSSKVSIDNNSQIIESSFSNPDNESEVLINEEIRIDIEEANNEKVVAREVDVIKVGHERTSSELEETLKFSHTKVEKEDCGFTTISEMKDEKAESHNALNLSIHKSEVNTALKDIEENQFNQHSESEAQFHKQHKIQTNAPNKNAFNFTIEKMLSPSSKEYSQNNQTTERFKSFEQKDWQGNKINARTFDKSDRFKLPEKFDIKHCENAENEKMKSNGMENPSSTVRVEENCKVIVERVCLMDELVGEAPISPCLNYCSAPVLPISTELIPIRYGVYNTVIPTERVNVDISKHSRNPKENEGIYNSKSPLIESEVVSNVISNQPTNESEDGIKNSVQIKEDDSSVQNCPSENYLNELASEKSENDIEIVQLGQYNYQGDSQIRKIENPVIENNETEQRIHSKIDCGAYNQIEWQSDAAPRTTVIDTTSIKASPGQGCPRCGGVVFAAEEVLARGRPWHIKCFKCKDCTKTLDSIIACDGPDSDVYCKTCYNKNWGPHGYTTADDVQQPQKCFYPSSVNMVQIGNTQMFQSPESVKKTDDSVASNNSLAGHANEFCVKMQTRKSIDSIINCLKTKELVDYDQNLQLDNEVEMINANVKMEPNTSSTNYDDLSMNEIRHTAQQINLAMNIEISEQTFVQNNHQPNIQVAPSDIKPLEVPYKDECVDVLSTKSMDKQQNYSISQTNSVESSLPQTEDFQTLPNSSVNKVIPSEGIDSFQSANNISIQNSFPLFSNNSANNMPFIQSNVVDFEAKVASPLNQPEVFMNNAPQSTPLRAQDTTLPGDSIMVNIEDFFDLDFNAVNETAADTALQMIFDNPSEFWRLCNLSDVGCEVTVDNTNVGGIAAKQDITSELQEQLIDSISPYNTEEEFDSTAPSDPMVGGQKELDPDPKQDSNLDETPFPQSALSFDDEDMMHRYGLFSMTQPSSTERLNQIKSGDSTVCQEVAERIQNSEDKVMNQKPIDHSEVERTLSISDQYLGADFSNCDSSTRTEQVMVSGSNNSRPSKNSSSKNQKSLSPNSSTETCKSADKSIGKISAKVQKIPACKYAPPKKPRNNETCQTKKPQVTAEVKESKHTPRWVEKSRDLTLDLGLNRTLDMPQLLSPTDNTSWKNKSLPSNHKIKNEPKPSPINIKSKSDSKAGKSERKEDVAVEITDKLLQDDDIQQMQYNMYDRAKANKRNAARGQNYSKFYVDDSSSNKNRKRKMIIKEEPIKQEPIHPNSPNVKKETSEQWKSNEIEIQPKKIKIEASSPVDGKQGEFYKPEMSQKTSYVRDTDSAFDALKRSGPFKASSLNSNRNTRSERILRSAHEGHDSYRPAPSTSSQYNYSDRAKREEPRRYTDPYRKNEDFRRQPKRPDRSRSPHLGSSSTSSDYRRDRRSAYQETKRNDSSHGRESQLSSEERRRTSEGHHSRDAYKKGNRWPKRDCPTSHPHGPVFNRPHSNQSKPKPETGNGKKEWFEVLGEKYPHDYEGVY